MNDRESLADRIIRLIAEYGGAPLPRPQDPVLRDLEQAWQLPATRCCPLLEQKGL